MQVFSWLRSLPVLALSLAACGEVELPRSYASESSELDVDAGYLEAIEFDDECERHQPSGYCFANDLPGRYVQIDRLGMPGVTTLLISSSDAYNEAGLADDLGAVFLEEITQNLAALQFMLADDIVALGLQPCALAQCVLHVGPLVIPDTLRLHPIGKAKFPNGRQLDSPVFDVMLAHMLLDPWADIQGPWVFIGVLNPTSNDVPFSDEFPYLAPPH